MQSFDGKSALNPLCSSIYRYSGQPIYAVHEVVDKSLEIIRQLHSQPHTVTGYPTGLTDLDIMLSGLQPGSLTVIASRPSMGKSALALNIIQSLSIKNTIPTAVFSMELAKEQLVMRMLLSIARVDTGKARTGHLSESDLHKINDAIDLLRKSAIYIDDSSGISITELLAKVIRLKVDHNVQIIVIDCLQLMRDDSRTALKPIIGCEVYLAPDSRLSKGANGISETVYHLILLCENIKGYRNLSCLTSAGYTEGFYCHPRIDRKLLAQHSEGLIALSACLKGEVAMQCARNLIEDALETARWYSELFPGRYYIELQENTMQEQYVVNKKLLEVAKTLNLPLVATNDCHYLNREDAKAHEVLLCIQTEKSISDPTRMRFPTDEFYVKTPDEMVAAFSYAPEAIANTVIIAERCNLELPLEQECYFPHFVPVGGKTHDELLEQRATEGLKERLVAIRAKHPEMTPEQEQVYWDRLRIELNYIQQMKFPAYFLIVADFINWAKSQGIPVGPGRGSAAGSLLAYAIKITDLDPLPYNLLFERFLNPERVTMPDINVDLCHDQREKVIEYLVEKYGRERVCQVIAFKTMKTRDAVLDIGNAMDMDFSVLNRIVKMISDDVKMTIKKAIRQEPQLMAMADVDHKVAQLLDTTCCLEGLVCRVGVHESGVVVAPNQLEEFLPIYKDQKTGIISTQYSMKYVDMAGLITFNLHGLKMLALIQNVVLLVREGKDPRFDITLLRDDDQTSYELISAGNTVGIFQLQSKGMKRFMARLKPICFEELIAAYALYRPGPLECGMVDEFIERKHGRQQVVYDLPQLEPILKETYGVIVYQEQVMQIARCLTGYSLGRAGLLWRAMSRKDPAVMAKEKEPFLACAKAQGVDLKRAEVVFEQLATFAEHGFNKSHSATYALISYQTAYLKAHYPYEFEKALGR